MSFKNFQPITDYERSIQNPAPKVGFQAKLRIAERKAWEDHQKAKNEIASSHIKAASSQPRSKMAFGRSYRSSKHNVTFTYHDPQSLSKKQQAFINRFARRVQLAPSELAPYIDLCFQLLRQEITQSQFEGATKLKLNIDTFDQLHDHNL